VGKSYGNFSVAFFTIGENPILKKTERELDCLLSHSGLFILWHWLCQFHYLLSFCCLTKESEQKTHQPSIQASPDVSLKILKRNKNIPQFCQRLQ